MPDPADQTAAPPPDESVRAFGLPVSKKLTALGGTGVGVLLMGYFGDADPATKGRLIVLAGVYIVVQGVVDAVKAYAEADKRLKQMTARAARYQQERDADRKTVADLRAWATKYLPNAPRPAEDKPDA